MKYAILFLLLFSLSILAEELPDLLPLATLKQKPFIEFANDPHGQQVPYASRIMWDGVLQDNHSQFFLETFSSSVPIGKKIVMNSPRWEYPDDTILTHTLYLDDKERSLFELRIIWKKNGQWFFGQYHPQKDQSGQTVFKRHLSWPSDFQNKTIQRPNGQTGILSIRPINPQSCQHCHFASLPSTIRPTSKADTGPCGFNQRNQQQVLDWANNYFKQFNSYPLQGN